MFSAKNLSKTTSFVLWRKVEKAKNNFFCVFLLLCLAIIKINLIFVPN